jgi:uncharacterized protein YqgV (UPF0045/DUF77 family)
MKVHAQTSLYVLRKEPLGPSIDQFLDGLQRFRLELIPGPMSTHITGDSKNLFAGLQEAFERAAQHAEVVLEVKISNACPGTDKRECEVTQNGKRNDRRLV